MRFRGRAGKEPIIGHLKSDHRIWRNFLSGNEGDKLNTKIATRYFNIKKFLNRVKFRFRKTIYIITRMYCSISIGFVNVYF